MFSSPSLNHFENGRSHSRAFVNGFDQLRRSRARRSQKATKSRSASSYRSAFAFAWAVKAGSGGNVRLSASRFSMAASLGALGSTLTWPLLRCRTVFVRDECEAFYGGRRMLPPHG